MSELKATYGIIGDPLDHSLSPVMHNAAFAELGVEAVYKCFPLKEDELHTFFEELRRPDCPIFGLNVTVPYKESVIQYLDSLSPFAEKAMSVNTIVISEDRSFFGHNTDGPGFLAHLSELNVSTEGKRVAILGAGGTAKALITAFCLLPDGPESIRIYNRTVSRAEELIAEISHRVDADHLHLAESLDDLNLELADILINTTPVGLKSGDASPVDAGLIHPNLFVYDVIYNPKETPLLKLARGKGARVANGLGMLFYQGVLSLQHWADNEIGPEVKEKMRKSLEDALAS